MYTILRAWCYSSARCTCALLNKQSHANHSFRASFDWLYGYHVHDLLRARYYSALLRDALLNEQAMPTIHSSCASLFVAVLMYTICCVCVLQWCNSALLHVCIAE
jgi:hypothetical protein